ncbi:MAG: M24 family metallopeptidase [Actinophytocola sp.]|nr:M24 family metallopeptidase [Actinophytocola sp.]
MKNTAANPVVVAPASLHQWVPQLSLAERDRRWAGIRELMSLAGLDALVLIANDMSFGMATANVRYLTQVGSLCGGEAAFFLDSDPVVWNSNQPQMHEPCNGYLQTQRWTTDIRRSEGMAGVADELRKRGCDSGRIGVAPFSSALFATPYILASQQAALERELPNATLVPAGWLLEQLRLIKSDEEIGMIRRAAEISRIALDAMVAAARPGTPEAVVAADMLRTQVANGAEPQVFNFLSSGPVEHPPSEVWRLLHATEPPGAPTMRPLNQGDIVVTEYHICYGGYLAGTEFTVYVGERAPAQLKAIFDVCVETLEASLELRPGMTIREAYTTIRRPVERAGMDFVELGFHGHGLASPEFPTVVHRPGQGGPTSMDGSRIGELVLREGMVLCNNIDVYDPRWKPDVGCMYGDTVVVGADATTRLVDIPTELPEPA